GSQLVSKTSRTGSIPVTPALWRCRLKVWQRFAKPPGEISLGGLTPLISVCGRGPVRVRISLLPYGFVGPEERRRLARSQTWVRVPYEALFARVAKREGGGLQNR